MLLYILMGFPEKPDIVILAAAKVGGIYANSTQPANFINENLSIQNNVIHGSYLAGTQTLIFLGSSCIFPSECPQPIKEEYLLTGPLEATNRPYAISKIAGLELCWAYNRQYGTQYLAPMPANLYGYGDNYDLNHSHVLPALIRKAHEAKIVGDTSIRAWGSGNPKREFLFSEDFAEAIVFLMQLLWDKKLTMLEEDQPPIINIGSGEELSVAELLALICEEVGFKGDIIWDNAKPDGTPRKILDNKRLRALGWAAQTPLRDGIKLAYQNFLRRH